MPAPANDDFANAQLLTGNSGSASGTTVGATSDFPATEWFSIAGNVWYKWVAPADGVLILDTFDLVDAPGNSSDTAISVYTGANFSSLINVGNNDDATDAPAGLPYRSKITIGISSGSTYYIEIEAYDAGAFNLTWHAYTYHPSYSTSLLTEWKVGVFDRNALPQNSTSYDGLVTDEFLKHAFNLKLTYPLNGIDQLNFSLYLDDPAATLIKKKTTFIRVWRFINDTIHSKTRSPAWANPDFAGVVTAIEKNGEANTMDVTVMGALWRVQTHFHIANHRLVKDKADFISSPYEGGNGNDLPWDHSALMFRLIDLINGAFKASGGDTGIRKPLTAAYSGTGYLSGYSLYWPQTIEVSPFYVQKGTYTWSYFYDDLLSRAASPDIVPTYIYNLGQQDLMYFNTAIVRGTDITGSFSFDYRTGNKNLDDASESSQVVPGTQANFVWVFGDGGQNSGNIADASDPSDMVTNGLFMSSEQVPGTKLADLYALADDKLAIGKIADAPVYSIKLSPASGEYYDLDYTLGDLVMFNADRGALQASNLKQRIYQVVLGQSENNVESADIQISADFKRRFP